MVRRSWGLGLLTLGLLATIAGAQMQSLLKGQGWPTPQTKEVYVSVYLNRLLEVDDKAYLHRNTLYVYITWSDPTANLKVLEATKKMKNGTRCSRPCTSLVDNVECCDGIYLPSFTFRNLYAFPEDRLEDYRIYFMGATVVWATTVHGVYFQPMDFSHFPFDSFDLIVELEFWSPTYWSPEFTEYSDGNSTYEYYQYHEGVKVIPSSGGPKLYSIGKGDDTAQWKITDFRVEAANDTDMGQWFENYSTIYSDDKDPAPLKPSEDNIWWGCDPQVTDECGNIFSYTREQWLGIYITVSRFQTYQLLNSVLPVFLCAMLGFIIFSLELKDLSSRLEIIATLFLALTAVQFVLVDNTPVSSYVIPTQQLVMATYLLFAVLALQSVIVSHVTMWPERKKAAERRKEGLQRYRSSGSPAARPSKSFNTLSMEGATSVFAEDDTIPSHTIPSGNNADMESADGSRRRFRGVFGCFGKGGTKHSTRPALLRRSSSVKSHLEEDEAYAEFVGYILDIVFGCFLLAAYILTAVLIFILQDGYIDLFSASKQIV